MRFKEILHLLKDTIAKFYAHKFFHMCFICCSLFGLKNIHIVILELILYFIY